MKQNAETGARGKEGPKHTQTHQKIADVGHQSACAVAVHRQDGATLVGVVRALVKPVATVIQNVVHKNGMLAFRPRSVVGELHFAAVAGGTLRTGIALQNKFLKSRSEERRVGKECRTRWAQEN